MGNRKSVERNSINEERKKKQMEMIERNYQVFKLHYGGFTFEKIGELYGFTRQRAQQIYKKILADWKRGTKKGGIK